MKICKKLLLALACFILRKVVADALDATVSHISAILNVRKQQVLRSVNWQLKNSEPGEIISNSFWTCDPEVKDSRPGGVGYLVWNDGHV